MPFNLYFPTPFLEVTPEDDTDNLLQDIQKEIEECVSQVKSNDDFESLSDASYDENFETIGHRKSTSGIPFTAFSNNVIQKYSLRKFTEYIQTHVQKYVNTTQWSLLTDPAREGSPYSISMSDSWLNITRKGNYHNFHIHAHHSISGVYYHKMNPNMGGITFRNPNPIMSNMMFPEGPISPNMITMVPEEGSLIIFPSWLEHGTQKNNTDEERITLSFNINIF